MQFYFWEENKDILQLYYPISEKQLPLIAGSQFKQFPYRFFGQKPLCPILSKEYALRVASEPSNWSMQKTQFVYILRFLVQIDHIRKYIQGDIDNPNTRIVIPGNYITQLNNAIVGFIEVIQSIDLNEFKLKCPTN